MIFGTRATHFASLRHQGSFGHTLAAAEPGWEINDHDRRRSQKFLLFVGVCVVLTLLVLAVSATIHLLRRRSKLDTAEATEHPRRFWDQPSWWQAALLFIGLSPLLICFGIGNYYENVVIVMVLMHNGCMLLFPSLYYALRGYADPDAIDATVKFYRAFWKQQTRQWIWKVLRGIMLGIPVFLMLTICYELANCRTSRWFLCVHKFERGLEANGLKHHSLAFRCLGLLYFTLINPIYEEFFWRVFLHRELGLTRLMILVSRGTATAPDVSQGFESQASIYSSRSTSPTFAGGDSLRPVELSAGEFRQVMNLTPDAHLRAPILDSEEKQGAFHEVVYKIKEGFYCYRHALSWSEETHEKGTRAAVWQSIFLRWGVSMMYGSYHMWPISVIFQSTGVIYAIGGFFFLSALGRGFLFLRECHNFGIIAALVVHGFVDAAFAAICLYEF